MPKQREGQGSSSDHLVNSALESNGNAVNWSSRPASGPLNLELSNRVDIYYGRHGTTSRGQQGSQTLSAGTGNRRVVQHRSRLDLTKKQSLRGSSTWQFTLIIDYPDGDCSRQGCGLLVAKPLSDYSSTWLVAFGVSFAYKS